MPELDPTPPPFSTIDTSSMEAVPAHEAVGRTVTLPSGNVREISEVIFREDGFYIAVNPGGPEIWDFLTGPPGTILCHPKPEVLEFQASTLWRMAADAGDHHERADLEPKAVVVRTAVSELRGIADLMARIGAGTEPVTITILPDPRPIAYHTDMVCDGCSHGVQAHDTDTGCRYCNCPYHWTAFPGVDLS